MTDPDVVTDIDRLVAALQKINAIRDSIVSTQTVNWSEHVYPLVAALNEAGFQGKPYPADREYLGSLIQQRDAAVAERDAQRQRAEDAEAEVDRLTARVRELAEVRLERFEYQSGSTDMVLKANPVLIQEFANTMVALLAEHAAPNYVSFSVTHPKHGRFEMNCQRSAGKRPAEVATEQRERADAAEVERDSLRAQAVDINARALRERDIAEEQTRRADHWETQSGQLRRDADALRAQLTEMSLERDRWEVEAEQWRTKYERAEADAKAATARVADIEARTKWEANGAQMKDERVAPVGADGWCEDGT